MFVSHIIDAFGGKSSSCWTPDDPFIQKKRPILTPFQRENRKIQGAGQKRKVQQTLEFTGLFWRRGWDSNPCAIARKLISSRYRYDLFDSPPYISTVFRALRKCKKNTQEQYEILKFDPAKTLINQGFSAEKTARANAHFEPFGEEIQWKLMRSSRDP